MIIVTLGSYSSGSTWIFNVVRSIISFTSKNSVSLYCDDSNDLLKRLPVESDYAVIKSHSIDQKFFNLIKITNAKVIISTRDPRDSYVSLFERFGYTETELFDQISRSFTVSAIARSDLNCLAFIYEDGFTEDPKTIDLIANYIGITLDTAIRDAIFAQHSRASVESTVRRFEEQGHDPRWFDPATHWHPRHIGDGKVGKWRDALSPERAGVLNDALSVYYDGTYRGAETILWQPSLFTFADGRSPGGKCELLQTEGIDAHLVYGPYLFLPPGRWQAQFLLSTSSVSVNSASLRIDIGTFSSSLDLYAMKKITVLNNCEQPSILEFEHKDHLSHIEARIHSTSDGASAGFYFSGVRFSWIGHLSHQIRDSVPIEPSYLS